MSIGRLFAIYRPATKPTPAEMPPTIALARIFPQLSFSNAEVPAFEAAPIPVAPQKPPIPVANAAPVRPAKIKLPQLKSSKGPFLHKG
jgi:hypothetical protein